MRRRATAELAASAAAVAAVAGIGGAVSARSVAGWYQQLDRPDWRPPDSVFGPVWTALYGQLAVAAWLVRRGDRQGSGPALRLYGAQLLLNLGWTLLFFGLRRPGLAMLEIAALWLLIVATVVAFRRHSRSAALLLLPYLLWVTFAAALNYDIWRRNR